MTELHGDALGRGMRAVIVAVVLIGVVKAEDKVLDHGKPNAQVIPGRLGQMYNIGGHQAAANQLPAQGEWKRGQVHRVTETGERLRGGSILGSLGFSRRDPHAYDVVKKILKSVQARRGLV